MLQLVVDILLSPTYHLSWPNLVTELSVEQLSRFWRLKDSSMISYRWFSQAARLLGVMSKKENSDIRISWRVSHFNSKFCFAWNYEKSICPSSHHTHLSISIHGSPFRNVSKLTKFVASQSDVQSCKMSTWPYRISVLCLPLTRAERCLVEVWGCLKLLASMVEWKLLR